MKIFYKGDVEPRRGSKGAAGWDIHANETVVLERMMPTLIPTGLSVKIPEGYYLAIVPRSGLSLKGLMIVNSPATLDSDYTGEIKVLMVLIHPHCLEFEITKGMRVGQLILKKYEDQEYEKVTDLEQTERGSGGFGSTGI